MNRSLDCRNLEVLRKRWGLRAQLTEHSLAALLKSELHQTAKFCCAAGQSPWAGLQSQRQRAVGTAGKVAWARRTAPGEVEQHPGLHQEKSRHARDGNKSTATQFSIKCCARIRTPAARWPLRSPTEGTSS